MNLYTETETCVFSIIVTFFGKMDTNAFSLNGQEKRFSTDTKLKRLNGFHNGLNR